MGRTTGYVNLGKRKWLNLPPGIGLRHVFEQVDPQNDSAMQKNRRRFCRGNSDLPSNQKTPSMAATVARSQKDVNRDRLTFDAASKRRFDENGFLHVEASPISKEAVNDYYGHEMYNMTA